MAKAYAAFARAAGAAPDLAVHLDKGIPAGAGLGGGSSDAIRRLEREALALAALRHPGICRVLDLVRVDETPHIVMEYVDGATLAEP